MSQALRSIAFWTGIILLVVLSGLGLKSALDLDPAQTIGQQVATVTQYGYALAGAVGAAALVARQAWGAGFVWLWAGLVTLTGGLAPIVWAGSALVPGLVAGVACGAVAAIVVWLTTRRGVRE
jgi:hypothetical protein